jgi:hypothetical protein
MSLKIEHLLEDELNWELNFRNIPFQSDDKVVDKQRLLRTSLRAIAKGAQDTEGGFGEGFDKEVEVEVITNKIRNIGAVLEDKGQKSREYGLLESRLLHIKRRVVALIKLIDDQEKAKSVIQSLSDVNELLSRFFPNNILGASSAVPTPTEPLVRLLPDFQVTTESETEVDTSKGARRKTAQRAQFPLQLPSQQVTGVATTLGYGAQSEITQSMADAEKHLKLSVDAIKQQVKMNQPEKIKSVRTNIEAEEYSERDTRETVKWLKDKETKLKNMRIATENKIKQMEEKDNSTDMSEEEMETLLGLKEALELQIEIAKAKRNRQQKSQIPIPPKASVETIGKNQKNLLLSSSESSEKSLPPRQKPLSPISDKQKEPIIILKPKEKLKKGSSKLVTPSSSESEEERPPIKQKSRRKTKPSSDDEKGIKVEKWGFRYSSTGGLSLVEFLRRVDRYKETQNVSERDLVRKAFFLFEGVALDWYDENRSKFQTWEQVTDGLRRAFVSEDNDYLVRKKCESRIQQKHETFEVFHAQMSKLFKGLSYKLSEKEKFEILKRNVKPSHRIGVALMKIENLDELKDACRRLDSLDNSLYSLATDVPNQRQQSNHSVHEVEQREETNERTEKEKKKQKGKKKKKSEKNTEKVDSEQEKTVAAIAQQPNQASNNQVGGQTQQENAPSGQANFSNQGKKQWSNKKNNSGRNNWQNAPNMAANLQQLMGLLQGPQQGFAANNPYVPNQAQQSSWNGWSNEVAGQNHNGQQNFPNVFASPFQPNAAHQFNAQTQHRVQPVNQNQQMICWNCDGFNHHQKYCMAPRRVFCWGCGRKDTYHDQCPTCAGNELQRSGMGVPQPH